MMHKDLAEEEAEWDPKYPVRDYQKQEACLHEHFKIFFKCKCSLTLGESDLEKIREIIARAPKKKVRVVLLES